VCYEHFDVSKLKVGSVQQLKKVYWSIFLGDNSNEIKTICQVSQHLGLGPLEVPQNYVHACPLRNLV